jgi:PAS domain S-box-containing protein
MTIIIGSCLAVNISASLILYKYRLVLEQLEDRLELKTDNLHNVIKNLKQEREDCRRLAAGLQQRDEQYRALMNQVNEGVLLLDAEGNLLQANRKLQELLRLSEADLLSKTWAQLFPAEEGRRTAAALAQVVATGAAKLTASWIIGPDRQRIPVALACHKVNCAGKPVIQGVFTFMEPTEPRPVILAS